jgi:hypothetical protein
LVKLSLKLKKDFVKLFSPTQIKIQPENATISKLLVKKKTKIQQQQKKLKKI